jgi:DNA-binding NarL/FixJ family response regulator
MPNARGEITNRDVRIMRELRAAGNKMDVIAEAMGLSRTTVRRYVRDVLPDRSVLACAQIARGRLETKALRYSTFVERASAFVPVFGSAA